MSNMISCKDLIEQVSSRLIIDEEIRNYESKIIVSEVCGLDFSELYLSSVTLDGKKTLALDRIIDERNTGKPLAYVLRSATFRELDLYVDERVLIPRSETEYVCEIALEAIKNVNSPKVLEIGVGSGAISLSVAHENKSANVIGVDVSKDALEVARLNLAAVGSSASRVDFLLSDLVDSLDKSLNNSFDLIVSNPPYIGEDERVDLPDAVLNHEPEIALFSEDNGYSHYERIMIVAKQWLKENGVVVFEIAPRHVNRFENEYSKYGFKNIEIKDDLTGTARAVKLSI